MSRDFVPYSCQTIDDEDVDAVAAVLRAPFLTQGPEIESFEEEFAKLHSAEHAIAVCNATAALHLACLALDIGPGDWVWTSPNSFVASANCARYCGASVDFVDIDPRTRNLSVEKLAELLEQARIEGRVPKAVIPVDFAGLPADVEAIRALATRYGFSIIEDASHAAGALVNGRPVGQFADITVFSFHAVKIITTGEGGLCTTDNPHLASRLRMLRSHGITRNTAEFESHEAGAWYYEQHCLGFNYRITDFQAALGRSQLRRVSSLQSAREAQARRYDELLKTYPVIVPLRQANLQSSHHLYAIELTSDVRSDRRTVFDKMRSNGIGVNVHYIPIHLQPYYRRFGFKPGDFPAAEEYYSRALSLPLFPTMTPDQQDRVVATLGDALQ